jgi:hypothetical protein
VRRSGSNIAVEPRDEHGPRRIRGPRARWLTASLGHLHMRSMFALLALLLVTCTLTYVDKQPHTVSLVEEDFRACDEDSPIEALLALECDDIGSTLGNMNAANWTSCYRRNEILIIVYSRLGDDSPDRRIARYALCGNTLTLWSSFSDSSSGILYLEDSRHTFVYVFKIANECTLIMRTPFLNAFIQDTIHTLEVTTDIPGDIECLNREIYK